MRLASVLVALLPLFASAGATKRKRYAQVGGQDHAVDATAAAAATTTAAATAAVVSTTATGSEVATAPEVALARPRTTDLAFRSATGVASGGRAYIDREKETGAPVPTVGFDMSRNKVAEKSAMAPESKSQGTIPMWKQLKVKQSLDADSTFTAVASNIRGSSLFGVMGSVLASSGKTKDRRYLVGYADGRRASFSSSQLDVLGSPVNPSWDLEGTVRALGGATSALLPVTLDGDSYLLARRIDHEFSIIPVLADRPGATSSVISRDEVIARVKAGRISGLKRERNACLMLILQSPILREAICVLARLSGISMPQCLIRAATTMTKATAQTKLAGVTL